MIRLEILRQKPHLFRSLTGMTIEQFEALFAKLLPIWKQQERKRLTRPNRQRAIGAGRKYRLSISDMLLMTLIWLRQYWNTEALGFFFGVDKATVSRNTRRMLKALQEIGIQSLGFPKPPRKGEGKSIEEVLESFPDLIAILDGTEQRIRRPKDGQIKREHYSGRRKAHTRKTVIAVNERGRIRAVTPSAPGSYHDLKVTIESGILKDIPEEIPILCDAGFDGLKKHFPERKIFTPHKARRNHPLILEEKLANRKFSSVRIVVEHILCRLKRFNILSFPFRHNLSLYDGVFLAVVGVVNFQMDWRNGGIVVV